MGRIFRFTGIAEEVEWKPTDVGDSKIWLRSDFAYQDAEKIIPCVNNSLIWTGEDKSTLGHDVIQATETKRPVYLTNQINSIYPCWRCDGIDDYLKALAFTLNQPCEVYMVIRIIAYGAGSRLFDGDAGNSMGLLQNSATQLVQYIGGYGAYLDFGAGPWGLIQSRYVNVSGDCYLRLNGGSPSAGAYAGAGSPGGFTLAAYGGLAAYGNIDVAEVVIYEPPLGDTDRQRLELYFNTEAQGNGYAIY